MRTCERSLRPLHCGLSRAFDLVDLTLAIVRVTESRGPTPLPHCIYRLRVQPPAQPTLFLQVPLPEVLDVILPVTVP